MGERGCERSRAFELFRLRGIETRRAQVVCAVLRLSSDTQDGIAFKVVPKLQDHFFHCPCKTEKEEREGSLRARASELKHERKRERDVK